MLEQLKVQATGLGLFFVGIALVGAWLGVAVFFGLLEVLHPAWAAAITGLITCTVVLLVMLLLRLKHKRQKRNRAAAAKDIAIPGIETILSGFLDENSTRFIQQHADRATLIALVLGGVAGYSPKSREVMLSVLKGMIAALQATESTDDSQTTKSDA